MERTEGAGARRVCIAEAAIEVIARNGGRGLSHRAVDSALGLPLGSVSYYFRTRKALLGAAITRLVQRDEQDVRDLVEALRKRGAAPDAATFVLELVRRWSRRDNRIWLAARFELLLEAARVGSQHPLIAARRKFLARAQALFVSLGAETPAISARRMIVVVEGLLLDELIRPQSAAALVRTVRGAQSWLLASGDAPAVPAERQRRPTRRPRRRPQERG